MEEFVRNVSRPDRDAASTPSGSHDRILWRCRVGHEWETSARQRAKYFTQCPSCLAGLWTSRLEFEVAELVEVATGLTVVVGARRGRVDRASDELVDLLVFETGTLLDLDPTRWHRGLESVSRDTRKLDRLAGAQYVRVRPRALGRLPSAHAGPLQQVLLSDGDEKDPWVWAMAVLEALRQLSPGIVVSALAPEEQRAARARADRRWRRLRSAARKRNLMSEHPAIAEQFVAVIDRPGLTPADLAPAGNDRVLWRCRDCGHQWEARTANRTLLGTGCPPCSYRRGAALSAMPRPGHSFADRHPHLVEFFLVNETHPEKKLFDLKPNSIDSCRWTCPHCARPWTATPHALNRRPTSGCRACAFKRGTGKRHRSQGRTRPEDQR